MIIRNNVESIFRILIQEKTFSDESMDTFASFSPIERWALIKLIVEHKGIKPIHFLHIPKTGGTTLGASLGKHAKALVIHVDCGFNQFLQQLRRLIGVTRRMLVLTRAHHSLTLLDKAGVLPIFSVMFTIYRNPLSVHVSNVSMILRRLKSYYLSKDMPENEKQFCIMWNNKFNRKFDFSPEFAQYLIQSKEYLEYTGEIFFSYLNHPDFESFVRNQNLLIFNSSTFDDIYVDVFSYESPPERLNVTTNSLLNVDNLSKDSIKKLIGRDSTIADFMLMNMSEPAALSKYVRGVVN